MMYDSDYYQRYQSRERFPWSREGGRICAFKAQLSLLRRLFPSPRLAIEVGCGRGFMSRHLTGFAESVISTDVSEAALHLARETLGDTPNVTLIRADAHGLPFSDNTSDIVVACDVIEHLAEPHKFFFEAYRVLKPRGILLIVTPNPSSLGCRVKGRHPELAGRPHRERAREWFGFRDETHINIRSIYEWRELSRRVGFETVRDGTDFWWDSPYIKHLPMNLHKFLFNGPSLLLTMIFGFLPWTYGENYHAV